MGPKFLSSQREFRCIFAHVGRGNIFFICGGPVLSTAFSHTSHELINNHNYLLSSPGLVTRRQGNSRFPRRSWDRTGLFSCRYYEPIQLLLSGVVPRNRPISPRDRTKTSLRYILASSCLFSRSSRHISLGTGRNRTGREDPRECSLNDGTGREFRLCPVPSVPKFPIPSRHF